MAEVGREVWSLNEGRGVNPGDTQPGTGRPRAAARTLNEGRGVNPGDTRRRHAPARLPRALNEGRGVNPGDTPNFSYGRWYETKLSV